VTELRDTLALTPIPDDTAARARVAAATGAAFATRRPRRRRRGATAGLLSALTLTATAAALAATGQSGAVTRWIADLVDPPEVARDAPLRADGRMLVITGGRAVLLDRAGRQTELGRFADATWSPHGLFVAGVRGRQLTAVDPRGEVRWTLTSSAPVADPRWGPDGYRIAYRSGTSLRVVAGDGSGDRLVARHAAPIPVAWRPGTSHELAYATPAGRVRVIDADTGSVATLEPVGGVRWLGWGDRPLAATRRAVLAPGTARRWHSPAPITALALHGGRLAVALRRGHLARVVLLDARTLRLRRALLTVRGPLTDLVWAPGGRTLAAARPGGWLTVGLDGRARARPGAARPLAWR
jgi:hypothetical protein